MVLRNKSGYRWRLRVSWVENMGFALGAMRSHKLRSFLTLLGVTAGVATVIMMVSFVVGFNEAIRAARERTAATRRAIRARGRRGPGDGRHRLGRRRSLSGPERG
jgi:macrolide transport system ATP-binding/permease protein